MPTRIARAAFVRSQAAVTSSTFALHSVAKGLKWSSAQSISARKDAERAESDRSHTEMVISGSACSL